MAAIVDEAVAEFRVVTLALGLFAAVAATRALQALLFEVTPTDPATFVAVPALFGLVTIGACLLPAWRAARVNPAETLRGD